MNREGYLAEIRKIVGNKKFTFSNAYVKKCSGTPIVGNDERRYSAVTKKYLYIECWGSYVFSNALNECGWVFKRYPICYRVGSGEKVTKVSLDELFTTDLEKIYNDIMFYLWWEKNERLPKLKKEYEECKKIADLFDKINK